MNQEQLEISRMYLNHLNPKIETSCIVDRIVQKDNYDVSVIIPCYNSEKYVRKAVDSASGVKSLGTSKHPGREVDRETAAPSVCLIFMPLPNPSVTLPGSYYPHLQIRKLRLREIKGLGYGHTQPESDGSGKRDQARTC